jgi:hypothetical protein
MLDAPRASDWKELGRVVASLGILDAVTDTFEGAVMSQDSAQASHRRVEESCYRFRTAVEALAFEAAALPSKFWDDLAHHRGLKFQ